MKKQDREKLMDMINEMLKITNLLVVPMKKIEAFKWKLEKVAYESGRDYEMMEFGIYLLNRLYDARIDSDFMWIDMLEGITYNTLKKYTFSDNIGE